MSRGAIRADVTIAGVGWFARIASAGSGLLTFRELFAAIGAEGVAAIGIIQMIGGWIGLLEIGTGFVSQNYLSKCRAFGLPGGRTVAKILIRPIYAIAIAAIVSSASRSTWVNFIIEGNAASALRDQPAALVTAVVIMLVGAVGIPAQRLMFAEGNGVFANLVPAGASVVTLVWVFTLGILGSSRLQDYIYATLLPINLTLVAIVLHRIVRGGRGRENGTQIEMPPWESHRDFTCFNVASTLVLKIDVFILSRVLSAEQLSIYIAVQKLFSLIFLGPQSLLATAHSRFAVFFAKKDWRSIKRLALQYSLVPNVIIIGCTVCAIAFDREIARLISSDVLSSLGWATLSLAGMYYALRLWTDTWATVLLAADRPKVMLLVCLIQGFITIPIIYFCALQWSTPGGYAGLIVSFSVTTVWSLPLAVSRIMPRDVK